MRKVASQEFTCLCVECIPIYQARRLGDREIRHVDRILNRLGMPLENRFWIRSICITPRKNWKTFRQMKSKYMAGVGDSSTEGCFLSSF